MCLGLSAATLALTARDSKIGRVAEVSASRALALAGLLSVVASGCRCSEPSGGTPSAPSAPTVSRKDERYPHAVIRRACTPTGRRALSLMLATDGVGCGSITSERLSFYLRKKLPLAAPVTLDLGDAEADGSGSKCPAGAEPCTTAIGGHAVFEQYEDDKRAVGTWSLVFSDGSTQHGSFDAKWCPPLDPSCK